MLASFFVLFAFIFTILPFISKILLSKSQKGNNQDSSIISTITGAFAWHIVSVFLLLIMFNMADIIGSKIHNGFVKETCFKEIFWNMDMNESSVERGSKAMLNRLSHAMNKTYDIPNNQMFQIYGSYTLIRTLYIIIQTTYALLPLVVFFYAVFEGYRSLDKKKEESSFSMLLHMMTYVLVAFFFYVVWINITELGMFLPDGTSLENEKINWWKSAFGT